MRAFLPEHGLARAAILDHVTALKRGDIAWAQGRAPIYVFKGDDAVASVAREAFLEYFNENALGAKRAFPSIRQMEEDIVGIGLSLLNAPAESTGYFTTGGTESIIGAVKACRNWSRERRGRRDQRFNMVLPETGHPAFTKAGDLMDIEVRRVPVGVDFRADPAAMEASDRCRHHPDRRLEPVLFLWCGRPHRGTFRGCVASRRLAARRRLRRWIPRAVRRRARL